MLEECDVFHTYDELWEWFARYGTFREFKHCTAMIASV